MDYEFLWSFNVNYIEMDEVTMNKQEFLEQLRRALSSRVGSAAVNENMACYEEYIATQVRMGKSEEEVIRELGDPRLLARSIAEAGKYEGAVSGADESVDGSQSNKENPLLHSYHMPLWLILVIILAVILVVIGAVFSILKMLLPILLPIAGIIFIVRLLNK